MCLLCESAVILRAYKCISSKIILFRGSGKTKIFVLKEAAVPKGFPMYSNFIFF